MERTYTTGFGGSGCVRDRSHRPGHLRVAADARDATRGLPGPDVDRRRHQPRTREADARDARRDADHLGGHRHRQAPVSALVYVWLLIAASIPLTAVVFVFGGVAPEDLVRGYLVLVVTALGLGAFGLFCSSIVKRTQAATAITIFGVLTLSSGRYSPSSSGRPWRRRPLPSGDAGRRAPAPGPLAVPQPVPGPGRDRSDRCPVLSENSLRYYCRFSDTFVLDQNGVIFINGVDTSGGGVIAPAIPAPPVPVGQGGGFAGGVVVSAGQGSGRRQRRRAVRCHRRHDLDQDRRRPGSSCRSSSCSSPSSSCRRPVAGGCAAARVPVEGAS